MRIIRERYLGEEPGNGAAKVAKKKKKKKV
jgi:hypothetical protein